MLLIHPFAIHNNSRCGYTGIVQGIQDAIRAEVERCIRLWGSSGRADDVLANCSAWQPVHHTIIYNVEKLSDAQVENVMALGQKMLGQIPGVRRVITGTTAQEQAKYKFSWLIEFVHSKVIDSYRDHPDHLRFANELFRPIASDRISIDFMQRPL